MLWSDVGISVWEPFHKTRSCIHHISKGHMLLPLSLTTCNYKLTKTERKKNPSQNYLQNRLDSCPTCAQKGTDSSCFYLSYFLACETDLSRHCAMLSTVLVLLLSTVEGHKRGERRKVFLTTFQKVYLMSFDIELNKSI